MKNLFKYMGIISLMVFSFYYTERIALFMQNKTDLMKTIKKEMRVKEVLSVDATIDGMYIVPGLNGLTVNIENSYLCMKDLGVYNEEYLVYDEVKPAISLNDNLDKIIKKASKIKNSISLIISDYNNITYLEQNKIYFDFLITTNYPKSDYAEYINNNFGDYYKVERWLNKYNLNKNICILNLYNKKFCIDNKKYLIEPTYVINNSNFASYINDVDRGDILKIESLNVNNLRVLINAIKYRDLDIVYLSELISEKNPKI